MEAGGDDLFVINDVEADQMEEVRDARPVEQAQETEAEAMESVKGLVPLCAQHAQGPQLSSATFGYDIALMAKRPWAEPGAKLSDYFNYGFNEQSWRPPMLMFGGIMDGYSDGGPYVGGHGMYGGQEGPGRGGGYGRPYQPREFHQHGGGGFERLHNANYKTRLCKSFAEGHCNRGDQCNFAHGVAGLAGGGSAPPPMAQIYGDHRPGFNSYYTPPPPQAMSGGAPPQAPERLNYLMPPFQGGAGMPPMMGGPAMPMQDSGDGAGSGFRQPPKRPRQDGDGVYEPQY
ncbi:Fip1 motif family protein [Leishmania donovani]|uniref:Fip1 motif family protein n=1 Tax=Leishmania donovani TaxID=5661 RepID=A0A504X4J5_LEIDO|nr:Fip1 motif family protein [Leishmania donovani]